CASTGSTPMPDLDSRTGFRHREWQKCWGLIKPDRKSEVNLCRAARYSNTVLWWGSTACRQEELDELRCDGAGVGGEIRQHFLGRCIEFNTARTAAGGGLVPFCCYLLPLRYSPFPSTPLSPLATGCFREH